MRGKTAVTASPGVVIGAAGDTPVCAPLMVSQAHTADSERKAPYQGVATARFVVEKCVAPVEPVTPDEIIDIEITYKLCDIIIYDPHNEIARWTAFNPDGAEVWILVDLGPFHFKRFLYIWRLTEISLYLNDFKLQAVKRKNAQPGNEFTWKFHGTMKELLGREVTESAITLTWQIGYETLAGVNVEWWPWDADVRVYMDEYISEISLSRTIPIRFPGPPYPVFNRDLCSISKTTAAPNEKFDIKVTIENQTEDKGNYFVNYYCEGNQGELATGTIDGYGTKSHTFRVTANELAQRSIQESQYLSFTIAISNDEEETDRWTPAAIAVIVEVPPETADLSGRVTHKQTGVALAGVSVTIAGYYSTSTDSSGYYALKGLEPGTYQIKFTKAGYWEQIKSKKLIAGENTLNLAMTPITEPEPGKIPWGLIAAGAGITGLMVILPKVKREEEK